MAQNKTVETELSVADFLNTVTDDVKRTDSFSLAEIMQQETGYEPIMWGTAIVGFGSYHYKYESGREGDAPLVAFSPRAKEISLYTAQSLESRQEFLRDLGKHKAAKACIYVKKLADINEDVLRKIIKTSMEYLQEKYPR